MKNTGYFINYIYNICCKTCILYKYKNNKLKCLTFDIPMLCREGRDLVSVYSKILSIHKH